MSNVSIVDDDEADEASLALQRGPPPWSVPIDPNTPVVAAAKPFIPPSMLEDDDET